MRKVCSHADARHERAECQAVDGIRNVIDENHGKQNDHRQEEKTTHGVAFKRPSVFLERSPRKGDIAASIHFHEGVKEFEGLAFRGKR